MPKKGQVNNLSGQVFGRLTVIQQAERKKRLTHWICECNCKKIDKNLVIVYAGNLKNGHTQSCGCLKFETKNQTHGKRYTRLYSIWIHMKDRCNNSNYPEYYLYGGRGIKVCPEWQNDFMAFYSWAMANGYDDSLSIDRYPDNNGNYEPFNCRWATAKEQANNRRPNPRWKKLKNKIHDSEVNCLMP